jgi:hypothetical protein
MARRYDNSSLPFDGIAQLELEADNARIRRDFKTMASFRFLAILARELLVRL